MTYDHCIECSKGLTVLPNGAWLRCCNGLGYWSELQPIPRDNWYPVIRKGKRVAYIKPGAAR